MGYKENTSGVILECYIIIVYERSNPLRYVDKSGYSSSEGMGKTEIDTLIESAAAPFRGGETIAGHALQKHAGRFQNIWGAVKGNSEVINQTALGHIDDVINGAGDFVKVTNDRGVTFLEKMLGDGRGVRLNLDGTFKGFIIGG